MSLLLNLTITFPSGKKLTTVLCNIEKILHYYDSDSDEHLMVRIEISELLETLEKRKYKTVQYDEKVWNKSDFGEFSGFLCDAIKNLPSFPIDTTLIPIPGNRVIDVKTGERKSRDILPFTKVFPDAGLDDPSLLTPVSNIIKTMVGKKNHGIYSGILGSLLMNESPKIIWFQGVRCGKTTLLKGLNTVHRIKVITPEEFSRINIFRIIGENPEITSICVEMSDDKHFIEVDKAFGKNLSFFKQMVVNVVFFSRFPPPTFLTGNVDHYRFPYSFSNNPKTVKERKEDAFLINKIDSVKIDSENLVNDVNTHTYRFDEWLISRLINLMKK